MVRGNIGRFSMHSKLLLLKIGMKDSFEKVCVVLLRRKK
jgi:hypothetical protein